MTGCFVGIAIRRHKLKGSKFGSGFRRHDARQIARIGKEQKDLLDGDRCPLLELNAVDHPKIAVAGSKYRPS